MNTPAGAGLGKDVFRTIGERLLLRSQSIARMAKTEYSFEEWINWEAYAACTERPGWTVDPKPPYRAIVGSGVRDLADLKVTGSGKPVFVEIAIVHDGTSDKWKAKLDRDTDKLARLPPTAAERLQIIVAVSHSRSVRNASDWERWFGQLKCFQLGMPLCEAKPLLTGGELVVYGWAS